MPSRTTITTREFRCRTPACHGKIHSVRHRVTYHRDYSTGGGSATLADGRSISSLRCDHCGEILHPYNPRGAGVREGQRTVAWLSPDGARVANLQESNGHRGPQARLYESAGWERVECDTIQKLDRINSIRTAQKTAELGLPVESRFAVADYDASTLAAEDQHLAAVEAGTAESDFIDDSKGVGDIIPEGG